jgi:hypothetical protein
MDRRAREITSRLAIYEVPGGAAQIHVHSDSSGNVVTGGTIKVKGDDQPAVTLNGYEAAMAELHAQAGGEIKKIDATCRPKKE